jgi:hypothetical protein
MCLSYLPPTFLMIESKARIKDKCELSIAVVDQDRSIEIGFAPVVLRYEMYKTGMRTDAPTTAGVQNLLPDQEY